MKLFLAKMSRFKIKFSLAFFIMAICLFAWYEQGHDEITAVYAKDIVGVIDGRRLVIPKEYAKFVEFEKRGAPSRLHETGESETRDNIASFSFAIPVWGADPGIRHHEIARIGQNGAALLLVTVRGNSSFHSNESLNALVDSAPQRFGVRFEKSFVDALELEKYTPFHPDANRNIRIAGRLRTLYIHRNNDGGVGTYFECRGELSKNPICVMQFTHVPTVRISLRVVMPLSELKNWRENRHVVEEKINSFLTK